MTARAALETALSAQAARLAKLENDLHETRLGWADEQIEHEQVKARLAAAEAVIRQKEKVIDIIDGKRMAAEARIATMREALGPFAGISLVHDHTPEGLDMIDAPDLAITPAQVRLARAAIRTTEAARVGETPEGGG